MNSWDFQGSNNPPLRLFYRNSHYASVSSSGGRNSNIQTIDPSEMEQKMLSQCQLLKTKDFHYISTRSVQDLSIADPELHYPVQLSKAIAESRKSFMVYYSSEEEKRKKEQ